MSASMAVTYAPTRKHFQGPDPGHGMQRSARRSSCAASDAGVTNAAKWAARRESGFAKLAESLAEEAGFEPASPFGPVVFKTTAFSHSATPPRLCSSIVGVGAAP